MNSKHIHATTIRYFLCKLLSGHLRSSWISNHSLCLKFKRTQYWPFSLLPKGNVFLEFFFVKFRARKVYWKIKFLDFISESRTNKLYTYMHQSLRIMMILFIILGVWKVMYHKMTNDNMTVRKWSRLWIWRLMIKIWQSHSPTNK